MDLLAWTAANVVVLAAVLTATERLLRRYDWRYIVATVVGFYSSAALAVTAALATEASAWLAVVASLPLLALTVGHSIRGASRVRAEREGAGA